MTPKTTRHLIEAGTWLTCIATTVTAGFLPGLGALLLSVIGASTLHRVITGHNMYREGDGS